MPVAFDEDLGEVRRLGTSPVIPLMRTPSPQITSTNSELRRQRAEMQLREAVSNALIARSVMILLLGCAPPSLCLV